MIKNWFPSRTGILPVPSTAQKPRQAGCLSYRARRIITLACLLAASTSALCADFTVKVADKEPPKELDASIRSVLQSKAIQVLESDKPAFEFWLCKEIPLQSAPESAAKAMDRIKQATLLGAVSVASPQHDYRDDALAAGVYTMRFALQPQDGNHLGTAEFSYFGVLTPAKLDTKLDGITDYKQLVKASSKETSTDHPAIISLRPPSAEAGEAPKLVEPVAEHKSVLLKTPAKAGGQSTTIPLEIVVEGKGHK
jgi:hypothetical protein